MKTVVEYKLYKFRDLFSFQVLTDENIAKHMVMLKDHLLNIIFIFDVLYYIVLKYISLNVMEKNLESWNTTTSFKSKAQKLNMVFSRSHDKA